ncbi:MAG: aspartate carbamoyltransferase catalytic subunit [Phycisphaeraceae bacterium]|nr:MAG: aspartate carbamoyltransferase catalytic subunit [Phycisphaeraceae bacterium]
MSTQAAPSRSGAGVSSVRHLLALQELDAAQIRALLAAARPYAEGGKGSDHGSESRATGSRATGSRTAGGLPLTGRTVCTLFFEDSTRTRASFTLAAMRLGADVIDLSAGSSISKGETLVDTARNIEAMGVDAIVTRDAAAGSAHLIARSVRCAVINGGDGPHEHPTQGLLDIYTLAEAHGRLDTFDLTGLKVAIVGDIATSRVARSNIAGMTKLGAEVTCVGPPNLCPPSIAALGDRVHHSHDLDAILPGMDAVMALRIQLERGAMVASLAEYAAFYQLSDERAARMKPGAIVMHPGPMNRGVEIASSVADGERSVVLRQASVGVAVRMGVLEGCVGGGAGAPGI